MDSENWIELAIAACAHAGIDYGSIKIIATWDQQYCANAVYRLGDRRYLKLFGPTAGRQFFIERSVLRTLEDYNTIPTPRIIDEGQRPQAPPYLIMTAISGSTAEDIWDDLSRSEQLAIARELGLITATVHRLPQDDLTIVEQQFGDKSERIALHAARRTAEIKATETLSTHERDALLSFLHLEAREHLDGPPNFTHSELAHNHIYLSREKGAMKVAGIIDWADAVLGPPEWDIVYLWFWTFSGDREAMRECLQALYADSRPPDRFARRCMAAILYTSSMSLLWPYFTQDAGATDSIVLEMIESFFPAELFGPPG